MTPRPPADPRVRGFLDLLAQAVAEGVLREVHEAGAAQRRHDAPVGELGRAVAGADDGGLHLPT